MKDYVVAERRRVDGLVERSCREDEKLKDLTSIWVGLDSCLGLLRIVREFRQKLREGMTQTHSRPSGVERKESLSARDTSKGSLHQEFSQEGRVRELRKYRR